MQLSHSSPDRYKDSYQSQLAQLVTFFAEPNAQPVPGVPLILRDYFVTLLELMLSLYPISEQQMIEVIKMLFNLSYISSIVRICTKMDQSEVAMWSKTVVPSGDVPKSMGDLVLYVIKQLQANHIVGVPDIQVAGKKLIIFIFDKNFKIIM